MKILLMYDCDISKESAQRGRMRRRTVPTNESNPLEKGIENLFTAQTIERLRTSHPQFFDISEAHTEIVRGVPREEPEKIAVNHSEKRNLCNILCASGQASDFGGFEAVFSIISEFIDSANGTVA